MKNNKWTGLQWSALVLSLLILLSGFLNQWLGWNLFAISYPAFSVISIFLGSLILWLFVAIDWPSVLCILLLGMGQLPETKLTQVFTLSFGNTTFVFLLFTFILTYALEQTAFLKRLVARFLHSDFAQKDPWNFLLAFFGALLIISLFISPTILFMIAYPIYEEIMKVLGFEKGSRQASLLLIATFSTIAIGTAMTPINHVFAITAMGLYESASGVAITNGQYMSFAFPAGLVIFFLLLICLRWVWKVDISQASMGQVASLQDLPEADKREKWIVSIFGLVILLWLMPEILAFILPGLASFLKTAGMAFPPIVGTLLLALLAPDGKPLISIQEGISKGVYWPSLLLVAATMSLGTLLTNKDIGVLGLLQSSLSPLFASLSPFVVLLVFVAWAGIQTNFSSNLVTVSLVTTVLTTITASADLGIHVGVVACLIGFMASLAFMTPPAMPYVAISVGSGWTNAKDTMVYGGWILLFSVLAACLVAYPIGTMIL